MKGLVLLITLVLPVVAQDPPATRNLDTLSLEDLMQVKVEGAALHPQTLQDAPASVTVITAEDIRKYGYRTLAEALSSVRGFYVSNNRSYETVGVRGFNLPGDYGSHLLVMVNGHNMADNVFDYMLFFGNDFPIDMSLIKQVEIIRGPSSALYGSNAMFATINIITKSPEDVDPLTVTADTGSFGEKKGQIVATASLGGANLLLSGSVFNNPGQSPIYFPQFATAQSNGEAVNVNTAKGYHLFSTLTWQDWTVTASFSGDNKIQPISWGNTIFNDRGTQVSDTRNYIEADYTRQIAGGELRWRIYYDSFKFLGREDYALSDGGVEANISNMTGSWVGSQLTYRVRPFFAGDVTVGVETNIDLRNLQRDYDVAPTCIEYLSTSHPDRSIALIFQDEKKLSARWTLDLGLRIDKSIYDHTFVAPRAALLYQRSDWTYKFLYGRSFRNPSPFQLFYSDGLSGVSNPTARPESADTVEVDVEHKIGKRMNVQASAYGYHLRNFLEGVYLPDGLLQYQNGLGIQAEGLEFEVNGRPKDWLEMTASYAIQRSRDDTILENSPQNLAKVHFAVPLGRKLDLSSGMQYQSSRLTLAGNSVKPVYTADFTLTTRHLMRDCDLRFGVRNAFNMSYSDPIALYPVVDSMPQARRTFFVELIAHRSR